MSSHAVLEITVGRVWREGAVKHKVASSLVAESSSPGDWHWIPTVFKGTANAAKVALNFLCCWLELGPEESKAPSLTLSRSFQC